MKGFFFAKPLEFRLETSVEGLVQGQQFEGTLAVCNRGADSLKGLEIALGLSYGILKKIKANEPDAYQSLARKILSDSLSLDPGGEAKVEWSTTLPPNCPITSQEGAVFLFYGLDLDSEGQRSKLDIQVKLAPVLETFVTSLENHFAFAAKSRRYENGYTEVLFKPPSSYPTVEELELLMRVNDKEEMDLQFTCRVRKFERGPGKGVKTIRVQAERIFPKSEYLLPNSQPNRALFQTQFAEILSEVAPPPVKKE